MKIFHKDIKEYEKPQEVKKTELDSKDIEEIQRYFKQTFGLKDQKYQNKIFSGRVEDRIDLLDMDSAFKENGSFKEIDANGTYFTATKIEFEEPDSMPVSKSLIALLEIQGKYKIALELKGCGDAEYHITIKKEFPMIEMPDIRDIDIGRSGGLTSCDDDYELGHSGGLTSCY